MTLRCRNHKAGGSSRWMTVTEPTQVVEIHAAILPKYKSIGRLGPSVLARNSRLLKYLPYFSDVEQCPAAGGQRIGEIEAYYHRDERRFRDQRTCFELAAWWTPTVKRFVTDLGIEVQDLVWSMLDDMADDATCGRCETDLCLMVEVEALRSRRPSTRDGRSIHMANLACAAFDRITGFSVWHVVIHDEVVGQALKRSERPGTDAGMLCSICFLHHCMIHGAYVEPPDACSGAVASGRGHRQGQSRVKINDDEPHLNERVMAVVPNKETRAGHQCGLYCVDPQTSIRAILGQRRGEGVGGVFHRGVNATRPALEDHEVCGAACFWQVEIRSESAQVSQIRSFEPDISKEAKELFKVLLGLYCNNQRVPCMIAADIIELTCLEAFYYTLAETQRHSHVAPTEWDADRRESHPTGPGAQRLDTSGSKDLDGRPPFVPCSHDGPCHSNPKCSCSRDRVHCEYSCDCDASCQRRYQGCRCVGRNKACFGNSRCTCWALNRECDPWLCGSCGAKDVLDPANKYNDEIRKGKCKNTKIQLGLPARTVMAPSEVHGWGLFAGQDLEQNAFIGEYVGERVGNQESDRRGAVYHHLGQEYLFTVNREQQIDGSCLSNKMRFVNNSRREGDINVQAKNLLCNGVQRIMLYAKRPIEAGQELLYDYNYPEWVYKHFWERGERPTRGRLPPPVSSAPRSSRPRQVGQPSGAEPPTTRMNLLSSTSRQNGIHARYEQPLDETSIRGVRRSTESSSVPRETRRKQVGDDDWLPAHAGTVRHASGGRVTEYPDDDMPESDGDVVSTGTSSDEYLPGDRESESRSPEAESAVSRPGTLREQRAGRSETSHALVCAGDNTVRERMAEPVREVKL